MKFGLPQYALGVSLLLIGYLTFGSGSTLRAGGSEKAASRDRLSSALLQPKLVAVRGGDPFRLASRRTTAKGVPISAGADPNATPESLDAVLISGNQRRAVINGHARTQGDTWRTQGGSARLVRVDMKSATIELAGRNIELRLSAGAANVSPATAKPGAGR